MSSGSPEIFAFVVVLYIGIGAFSLGYQNYLDRGLGQPVDIPGRRSLYVSLALHIVAFAMFAVGGHRTRTDAPFSLTNLFLLWSYALTAFSFRDIRASSERRPLQFLRLTIVAGVIVSAAIFFAPPAVALPLTALCLVLILGWTVYEARLLSGQQESFPIRVCYLLAVMSLLVTVALMAAAAMDWSPGSDPALRQEGGLFLYRLVREAMTLLLYIAALAYLLERLSAERTAWMKYVEEVRPLLDQRDSLSSALLLSNKVSSVGALAATLTHEIRQPVASLRINADLLAMNLKQKVVDTGSLLNLVNRISGGVERLTSVAESVERLFLAPIEAEGVSPDAEIEHLVAALGQGPEWANVQLQLSLGGVDDVAMSASHFRLLILNLLNNANAAFRRSNQHDRNIKISSRAQGRSVEVVVEDNGPGIAPALAANLFGLKEPGSGGGMGLGLWVIHHIVERYGGKIRCDNEPGSGAKFRITLPARDQDVPASARPL
jgi:signal transduction histidine kinase